MTKAIALAPNEAFRLDQCEKAIERGLNTFVEVGRALTEIRDSKLYRQTHRAFEVYCKERWEIGRSRAYELIDQAKVVTAIANSGVNLSGTPDISSRDARTIKDDLPAVSAEVKARVEQGVEPVVAVAEVVKETAEKAKAEKATQQASNIASQEAARAALPPSIQAAEQARADRAAAKRQPADASQDAADRIAELEEANRSLEAEVGRLKAENAKFAGMKAEYEKGGFAEVIKGKDAVIAAQASRIERESQEKVANLRSADWWRKKALEAGYSDREVIDLETVNG